MKILRYIAIDFLSTMIIFALGIILEPHVGGGASDYILIGVVCFFVGLFFTHGVAHGVSISAEVILRYMATLFMIGRPLSAPISDILKIGIIGPMLPFIVTGLFAGFVGGQIRKRRKNQKEERRLEK